MEACLGKRVYWFIFMFCLITSKVVSGEYQMMHICHGEIKRLKCDAGEVLTVYDTFYQSIGKNSTLCLGSKQTEVQCPILKLVGEVRQNCNNKEKCFVNYEANTDVSESTSCQTAIVLKVTYKCEKLDGPPPRLFNNVNFVNGNEVTVNSTTGLNASTNGGDIIERYPTEPVPLVLQLLYYFLDTRLIFKRIRAKPRGFLLAVTLSMAGGMLILVIFCCINAIYSRCKRTKDKVDMEDAQPAVDVSGPVVQTSVPVSYDTIVVTTANGSTSTHTTLNRDGTLNKKPKPMKNHELISTIRRSHSIDEGTQTDNESEMHGHAASKTSGSLSHEEAQELGYLVDVMKYFNSRLDDEFFPDTSSNNRKENDNRNFFFTTEIKNPSLTAPPLKKQISFTSTSTNRYLGDEELSSSDEKFKTMPRSATGKFPVENRKNDYDLNFYSPESIFNGDTLKFTTVPRTPKLGIRGDGYDVIMSEEGPSSSFK